MPTHFIVIIFSILLFFAGLFIGLMARPILAILTSFFSTIFLTIKFILEFCLGLMAIILINKIMAYMLIGWGLTLSTHNLYGILLLVTGTVIIFYCARKDMQERSIKKIMSHIIADIKSLHTFAYVLIGLGLGLPDDNLLKFIPLGIGTFLVFHITQKEEELTNKNG